MQKLLYQFKSHYCAAYIFARIKAVRPFRIYHGSSFRQQIFPLSILHLFIRNLVMIRHHYCHAKPFPIIDLGRRRDPVITSNDRIDPFRQSLFHQNFVQSITVPDPVGNHRIHQRSADRQPFEQNIRSANTVRVIIPDHPYLCSCCNFILQYGGRLVHIL